MKDRNFNYDLYKSNSKSRKRKLKKRGVLEILKLLELIRNVKQPNIVSQQVQFLKKYTDDYGLKFGKVVFLGEIWICLDASGLKSWH